MRTLRINEGVLIPAFSTRTISINFHNESICMFIRRRLLHLFHIEHTALSAEIHAPICGSFLLETRLTAMWHTQFHAIREEGG